METEHSFGAWIRRRRRALGLTQGELARLVGCAEVTVQKIEADERRPSAQVAALLARHVRLPADLHAPFVAVARGELVVERLPPPAAIDVAPPLSSPALMAAPAHNLPAELTSFVGRERELAVAAALLAEARLLTLTGPGGTGKTRLALRVAREALPHFPDGIRLVELAPLATPDLVVKAVAEALGLQEDPGRPLLHTLADTLLRRQLLLLLDNCEHLIDACARLAAALLQACPSLTVLASSREPLGVPGERVFRVPALALPEPGAAVTPEALASVEAVQLFVARARAAEPTFAVTEANATALARVCRRLDGIPLALELAAARVRHLTVAQIAERLEESFRLLTGGARTALPRHQTLTALIDWSYALLDPAERALLGRLAVFAGGWSLEAAEAVCGGEPVEDPLETLGRLTDKSLVQVERDRGVARYQMLETIRQYALERLAASGEANAVHSRHARFYCDMAAAANRKRYVVRDTLLSQLLLEQDNLRTALSWAQTADGAATLMLELAHYLAYLQLYQGFQDDARDLLEQALQASEGRAEPQIYLEANQAHGAFLGMMGHLERAETILIRGHRLAQTLGNILSEVLHKERLGCLARERGEPETAATWLQDALSLSRAAELPALSTRILTTMAGVAILREDVQGARALLEQSIDQSRALQDQHFVGWGLNHLGHAAQLEGNYEQAEQLHQESLAIFEGVLGEQNFATTWAWQSLGETALGRDDVAEARARFAKGLIQSRVIHDRVALGWCLAGLGTAAAYDEEPERAARLWGAAERLRLALGCRPAPASRTTYERALALVRAQLGAEAFAAEWAAGAALPLQAAVDEALALAAAR